jgi:hypothetical protein
LPAITIILPISREQHLLKVFASLELLECERDRTSLLAFDDGDADLFLTARNLVEQSKFAERVCVQGEIPGERREFSINTRRHRIAAMDRVIRTGDGRVEVGGYREWLAGGYFRDWRPQQIIEIRRLNPFKPDEPYSMSAAGTDSQFTLKQAGDFFWRTMLMAQRPTRPLNLASMAPLRPSTSAAPRQEATWCSRRLHQQGTQGEREALDEPEAQLCRRPQAVRARTTSNGIQLSSRGRLPA